MYNLCINWRVSVKYSYSLWIASTGKRVKRGKSAWKMSAFKSVLIRRALKSKRYGEMVKQAVKDDDLIVSWDDYDQFVRDGMPIEELEYHCRRVWRDVSRTK